MFLKHVGKKFLKILKAIKLLLYALIVRNKKRDLIYLRRNSLFIVSRLYYAN